MMSLCEQRMTTGKVKTDDIWSKTCSNLTSFTTKRSHLQLNLVLCGDSSCWPRPLNLLFVGVVRSNYITATNRNNHERPGTLSFGTYLRICKGTRKQYHHLIKYLHHDTRVTPHCINHHSAFIKSTVTTDHVMWHLLNVTCYCFLAVAMFTWNTKPLETQKQQERDDATAGFPPCEAATSCCNV